MSKVELVVGSYTNRNQLIDYNQLQSKVKELDGPAWRSIHRYDDDEVDSYLESKGSLKGYQGIIYSYWIWIDIDNDDLEQAREDTVFIISKLSNMGIDYQVYFSGNKGFHIRFLTETTGLQPSKDFHKHHKTVASYIAGSSEIDTGIYKKIGLIRLANTRHEEGLYKVQLDKELIEGSVEAIKEYAKKKQPLVDIKRTDIEVHPEFQDYLEKMASKVQKPTKYTTGKQGGALDTQDRMCIYKMLGTHLKNHEDRNECLCCIANHFKWRKGLDDSLVRSICYAWNQGNEDPIEDRELEASLSSQLEKNYSYSCRYPKLQFYCDPRCYLYTSSDIRDDKIVNLEDVGENYAGRLKKGFARKPILEGLGELTQGAYPGDFIVLVGASGIGKTTLAENVIKEQSKEDTILYLQMELSIYAAYEKLFRLGLQLEPSENNIDNLDNRSKLVELMKGLWFINEGGISTSELRQYISKASGIINKPINLVVIDSFGRLRQAKGTEGTQGEAKIARELKDLAKSFDTTVLAIHHASKTVDKYQALKSSDFLGSTRIQSEADMFIAASWVNNQPNEMRIQLLKSRYEYSGSDAMTKLYMNLETGVIK